MTPRRYALIIALALLIGFVAFNVIVSRLTPGARIDLTERQLYSLSQGTRETVRGLAEPIELTFYYSREAGENVPQVRAYASRVRELLQSYAGLGGARIRLREIDPLRFTEAEDRAVEAGLQPFTPPGGEPIYFGLIGANAVDERRAIAFFAPQREPFLEYEITRLVSELEQPRRIKLALVSALPLAPDIARDPRMNQQSPQPYWLQELARMAEIVQLQPGFTAIPDDAAMLVVIGPWRLGAGELRAMDQFILAKGRAVFALDPAVIVGAQGPQGPADPLAASALDPLLAAWGVALSKDVVLDREGALFLGPDAPPQPMFIDIAGARMNRADLATAGLMRGMSLVAAGAITTAPPSGVTITPLAHTTRNTMRLPAEQALMMPPGELLLSAWAPTGRQEDVAIRISGTLQSAFAGGAFTQSARPAEIILIGDTDFLDDRLYVDPREGPQRDNAAFLLNAIDLLSGSDSLVSLRSRAPSLRRLTEVDKMRAQAQAQVSEVQQRLQGELAATEQRIAAVQRRGDGSGFFQGNLGAEMTTDERREIERFRAKMVEIRSQLRQLERTLRVDLDRLQAIVMAINVWLAPVLVIIAGVLVSWRRRRRTRAKPLRDDAVPNPVEEPAQ